MLDLQTSYERLGRLEMQPTSKERRRVMVNHVVSDVMRQDLSVPGHTALMRYNHNTRKRSLACHECGAYLGTLQSVRWIEKHFAEMWAKHLGGEK